ncbi:MAG: hypothetical protein ACLQG5_10020 [Methanobacterium sp.]
MIIVEKIKKFLTLEFVVGVIGSVLGLQGAIFVINSSYVGIDGVSALLASLIGLLGAFCFKLNAKLGGIILIISSIWLLISIPTSYGIFAGALLAAAGLMGLFGNGKPALKKYS